MDWDVEVDILDGAVTVIPYLFNAAVLGIKIEASNNRETWYKSGYLQCFVDIDGERFLGKKFTLDFYGQLIEIPYANYQLEFQPVIYARDVKIKIKELSQTQVKAITNVNISGSTISREIGNPIYTTVTPTAFNAAEPVFRLVESRERQSALIMNKTNRPIYINEGANSPTSTLIADDPFVQIVPGGSYAVDEYDGEIYAIMSGAFANGGKIIVKELPYV
jgi:hypothetical protein